MAKAFRNMLLGVREKSMIATWKTPRRMYVFTALVLTIASPGIAGVVDYAAAVVADKPLAYWRFEETSVSLAADNATGNSSYDGTYQGGVSLVEGIAGQAASFNNVDSYIKLTSSLGDAFNGKAAITIDAWIFNADVPSGTTEDNLIFNTIIYTAKSGAVMQMEGTNISVGGRSVYIESSKKDAFQKQLAPYSSTNDWCHLVGVLDIAGDMIKIYIDGQLEVNQSVVFEKTSYTTLVPDLHRGLPSIGGATDLSKLFNGLIDEVAVYGRELSAAEVLEHYNLMPKPTANPEPATLALLALGGMALLKRRRT